MTPLPLCAVAFSKLGRSGGAGRRFVILQLAKIETNIIQKHIVCEREIAHLLCFLSLRLCFPPLLLGIGSLKNCSMSGLNLICGLVPPDDFVDLVVVVEDDDEVVEAECVCIDCS